MKRSRAYQSKLGGQRLSAQVGFEYSSQNHSGMWLLCKLWEPSLKLVYHYSAPVNQHRTSVDAKYSYSLHTLSTWSTTQQCKDPILEGLSMVDNSAGTSVWAQQLYDGIPAGDFVAVVPKQASSNMICL